MKWEPDDELLQNLRRDHRLNTASADFLESYRCVIEHGFDASCVAGWLADAAVAIDDRERRIEQMRQALIACGRYAYRMDHQEGHSLDRANARAIAEIVNETLGGR